MTESGQNRENNKKKEMNFKVILTFIFTALVLGLFVFIIQKDECMGESSQAAQFQATNSGEYQYDSLFTTLHKPVIYLYPEEKTEVDVQLKLAENVELKTTYPKYNDGWTVVATPEGELTDKDGKKYDYLFFDAITDEEYDFVQGYCIHRDNLIPFLEDALAQYGLNAREANDFIVYWLPRLEKSEYNLIAFDAEWYENCIELHVTPEPDSVLRLFMLFKPVDEMVNIAPQEIPEFTRKGFTVIEWGGAEF